MAYPSRVVLTEAQRAEVRGLAGSGTAPARALTRARVLLKAGHGEGGPGWSDAAIAGALAVTPSTALRVRRHRRRGPGRDPGAQAPGPRLRAPPGRPARGAPDRARLRGGPGRRRPLGPAPARRRTGAAGGGRGDLARDGAPGAQKNELKPWLVEQWCPAPTADPDFVWHTEDVLAVYERPFDPVRPVVCLDETSRQLLAEVRPPQPAAPGRPARRDPEHVRGGVANLFLATEPLRGWRTWRTVLVSDQRTRLDFAACVEELVDVHYPAAERIVVALDQLTTHSPASLYAAFPPAEAKRLADKLEIHHPPKHGSWLDMAELELSVLERQCLRRRLEDRDALEREVAAWAERRNAQTTRIDRQFTTADARTKLRRLYPAFQV